MHYTLNAEPGEIIQPPGKPYVPREPDVLIECHGSIHMFLPQNETARAWLVQHTDGQWFGGGLAVEYRYSYALVEGLADHGFCSASVLQ